MKRKTLALVICLAFTSLAEPPAKAVEEQAKSSTADLAAQCFEKAFEAHISGSCNGVEACAIVLAGKACAGPGPHPLVTFCIQRCQRTYTAVTKECFDSCVSPDGKKP